MAVDEDGNYVESWGYHFGHATHCAEPDEMYEYDNFRYVDNGASIYEEDRKCPKCNKKQRLNRHDPCIANLPGVLNACCGHGVEKGYIQFMDGTVIRGYFEVERSKR